MKDIFLRILQNSKEKTCARVSFIIKLQADTLTQVFSCEFCKSFKKTFLYRTPPVAASVIELIVDENRRPEAVHNKTIHLLQNSHLLRITFLS